MSNNNNINNTITLDNILDQTNMGTTISSSYLEDILTSTIGLNAEGVRNIYTVDGNSNINWNFKPTTRIEDNDIVIGGRSLMKTLEKLEERLSVLHPNPELESRWDELRELREHYVELERDILEKERIMRTLSR